MMEDGALKTLFLPFETGDVEAGGERARWLFLNAMKPPHGAMPEGASIHAVQGFKPAYDALVSAGIATTPDLPEAAFDGALILVSRHRGETRTWLNAALERVKPEGIIMLAGSKTDGIGSVSKEVGQLFPLLGSLSKNHAKVIWFANGGHERFVLQAPEPVDGRFHTAPGMFSATHADPGSTFLVENLPPDIKGRIADFCAGWGYLSVEVAARYPSVRGIALYEAHHASLQAARENMAKLAPHIEATFHWQDLVCEKATGNYDTIIMNPPFHQGRAAEPSIGMSIIRNAHGALHKGGRLYLVANRTLPYEATLETTFYKSGEIARNGSYKVLWAVK
jgi:16S rRNA (guanine1207-N2)-methyltransferase